MDALIGVAAYIPIKDSVERFRAVSRFKKNPRYQDFIAAIKRVKNILPKEGVAAFSVELLREQKEKELYSTFDEVEKKFEPLYREGEYDEALLELLLLPAPINGFFDGVLVMDKDRRLRENRLALLNKIWLSFSRIADFSKLSEV
jgi:glycyl-tRNA synthetase beta chain